MSIPISKTIESIKPSGIRKFFDIVSEINKWSSNYEFPVLYTSEWGEYSLGYTPELVLTELVVENCLQIQAESLLVIR